MGVVEKVRRPNARRVKRAEWYREQWRRAAAETGWDIEREIGEILVVRRDGERRFVHGPDAGLDRHVNFRLAGSGTLSTELFRSIGIPVPETQTFSLRDPRRVVAAAEAHDGPVVFKPAAGTGGGRGVTVAPPTRRLMFTAVLEVARYTSMIVLQQHVVGPVLRVLVLDGEVIDAVQRQPAHVIGDGRADVRKLIDAENDRRAELGVLATGFIPTGADARSAVARAGLSMGAVPASGLAVPVAGCSNTGSQEESRRVELTPAAVAVAVAAAEAVGVRVAGVDLIIDGDGQPAAILEVNSAPGLHWHLLVDGEPFDPFVAVLAVRSTSDASDRITRP